MASTTLTYPTIFNTYSKLPNFEVNIDEIERVVMERVRFLHMMSGYAENSEAPRYSNAFYYQLVSSHLITEAAYPTYFNILIQDQTSLSEEMKFDVRKTDHIAHYMTLLAFAMNPAIQQWFLNMEADFARFKVYVMRNVEGVVDDIGIPYSKPSEAELRDLAKKIEYSHPPSSHFHMNNESYLKINFIHALELVRHRTAFLKDGLVYVSKSQLGSVIGQRFRESVKDGLKLCASNSEFFLEDDRVARLAKLVSRAHQTLLLGVIHKGYNSNECSVSCLASMKPDSFPLCMKRLHYTLQQRRHLKYGDRMRLQVFLKGAGLSLSDSLRYWKESFYGTSGDGSRKDDGFAKYSYSIRYTYGEEGNRKSRTPYNCAKIISASGEDGCPFKNHENLDELLQKEGIVAIEDLGEILKEKTPQSKCAKYFKAVNHVDYLASTVEHPNEYYLRCIKLQPEAEKQSDNELGSNTVVEPSTGDKESERVLIFDQPRTEERKQSPSKNMEKCDGDGEADFSGLGYF